MKKTSKIFIAVIAVFAFASVSFKTKEAKEIDVVIDAGHGGNDLGAVYGSFSEKEIVEKISDKIKSQNENSDVVIHLTRISDEFSTLEECTKYINQINPDVVLSLHINSSPNLEKSGVELLISKDNPGYEKASSIAESLSNKFKKNNNFKVSEVKNASLKILKNSKAPAVTVELGYLTNSKDREYLIDNNQQNRIADTILELINEL